MANWRKILKNMLLAAKGVSELRPWMGLVAFVIAFFAGVLLGVAAWDTSWFLSEPSVIGQVIQSLTGNVLWPNGIQIVAHGLIVSLLSGSMILMGQTQDVLGKSTVTALAAMVVLTVFAVTFPDEAVAAKNVYSPIVEPGEAEMEYAENIKRESRSTDREVKLEIGYGMTEHWFTSVYSEFEGEDSLQFHAVAWENVLQLTEQGQYWADWGLYLEYEQSQRAQATNKWEAKALVEKSLRGFTHTANFILEQHVGDRADSALELAYAWRSAWRYHRWLQPAVEIYGELGKTSKVAFNNHHSHFAGPVISGKVRLTKFSKLGYKAGYLFGLTPESDHGIVTLMLEWERYFY